MSLAVDRPAMAPRAAVLPTAGLPAGSGASLLSRFPPRALASSWPVTEADRSGVLRRVLAPPFALELPASQQSRRLGVLSVVRWLQAQPGDSWQERWLANGAQEHAD